MLNTQTTLCSFEHAQNHINLLGCDAVRQLHHCFDHVKTQVSNRAPRMTTQQHIEFHGRAYTTLAFLVNSFDTPIDAGIASPGVNAADN